MWMTIIGVTGKPIIRCEFHLTYNLAASDIQSRAARFRASVLNQKFVAF
jgi:hypothetical protein